MRLTVDLFRATRMRPCRFETTVVREGPRLCLVDVHLLQDDDDPEGGPVATARASVLFLRTGEAPTGEVWMPRRRPAAAAARGRPGLRRAARAVPAQRRRLVAGLPRAPERRAQDHLEHPALDRLGRAADRLPGRRGDGRRHQPDQQLGQRRRRAHQRRHHPDPGPAPGRGDRGPARHRPRRARRHRGGHRHRLRPRGPPRHHRGHRDDQHPALGRPRLRRAGPRRPTSERGLRPRWRSGRATPARRAAARRAGR